jgi:hypothetical protein
MTAAKVATRLDLGGKEQLVDALVPYVEQFEYLGPSTVGPVAGTVATLEAALGRIDDADANFALAVALSERMDAVMFAAEVRITWAAMLVRPAIADAPRARVLLDEARAVAETGGYALLAKDAAVVATALAELERASGH